ncbi:hypothetical protein BDR06DRAFT_973708 [Suillus hirtellus]|nr:hypothetical protein BDR06DRAFT_973708 [Suillus hirtellus]
MAPDRTVQSGITADELRECQRAKLAAQARNSTNVVLELDDETGETLDVWYWPVNDNGAHDHNPNDPHEAAIVMSKWGLRTGEYIARCALSKCGYVVFIEQTFNSCGLPVKRYSRRSPDEARPLDIVFVDREGMSMEKLT